MTMTEQPVLTDRGPGSRIVEFLVVTILAFGLGKSLTFLVQMLFFSKGFTTPYLAAAQIVVSAVTLTISLVAVLFRKRRLAGVIAVIDLVVFVGLFVFGIILTGGQHNPVSQWGELATSDLLDLIPILGILYLYKRDPQIWTADTTTGWKALLALMVPQIALTVIFQTSASVSNAYFSPQVFLFLLAALCFCLTYADARHHYYGPALGTAIAAAIFAVNEVCYRLINLGTAASSTGDPDSMKNIQEGMAHQQQLIIGLVMLAAVLTGVGVNALMRNRPDAATTS